MIERMVRPTGFEPVTFCFGGNGFGPYLYVSSALQLSQLSPVCPIAVVLLGVLLGVGLGPAGGAR